MTRIRYPVVFGTVFFALSLVSTADAELYLMFNVGDGEDRAVQVAATSWEAVMNGSRPSKIDSNADRYFIHLPHSTMDTLSGAATRVGQASPSGNQAASMAASVAESADRSAATEDNENDTDWIEYEASAASLMLFSPDGLDEESDIRFEPARVFMRRVNGSVYVMITGQNGTPP